MGKTFSLEYIKHAHTATIHHEKEVLASTTCTCFYCGYQFDPNKEENLEWWDGESPKGKTLVCPKCGIDCVIGDASLLPITDPEFIMAFTEYWFGGYSRISDGLPVEKVLPTPIIVD
jgi:hypothetical protein